ncbi:MAG: hypothetical protein HY266_05445 [Deltaproteobacteria bacterium]|nr:hypothetical protein [Deltaproteobacteria bacterium]
MKKSVISYQLPVISKLKRFVVYGLLFTAYCSLLTVLPGCGKKAPPKPPQEAAWQR